MILHEAQKKIVEDGHRFRVVNAGRRFGKTVIAVEELLFSATTLKDASIAYIASTYSQAREISWEMLKRRTQEGIVSNINETRLEMSIKNRYGGHSRIVLKGWEAVDSLRGLSFDFIVLDEVALYRNFWTGWHEVLRPTLTDRRGKVLFISTPKGFSFWYDLYNLQYEDDDYKSFHFTSYDNPHIPADELDKARKEMTEDRFAQEYLADFRKQEGLVYKDFNRDRHVYDPDKEGEIDDAKTYLAGVDFGFTNPACVLDIKIDAMDNWWVTDEWYKTGKTDKEITEYVAAKKYNYVYPDPEAAAAIEEMKRKKINVREVIKGKDSIQNGIDNVRELLKNNKFKVSKKCLNTISEFESYVYPDSKDGELNEKEVPMDNMNHAMDALRYPVMMIMGGEIKSGVKVVKPAWKGYNRR